MSEINETVAIPIILNRRSFTTITTAMSKHGKIISISLEHGRSFHKTLTEKSAVVFQASRRKEIRCQPFDGHLVGNRESLNMSSVNDIS